MGNTFQVIIYIFAFLSTYVQIFFLVTFLEKRKKIEHRIGKVDLNYYPSTTIIVPCWNEETTLKSTIDSLLALDYPKEKLEIFLVDDGSTDNTWEIMKSFTSIPNIKVFHKENGGKHTAMNMGIELATSDFVGCLDADSFVDPQALRKIMSYFQRNPENMAVVPSIIVHKPKNLIQKIQMIDYQWGVYNKKMLALLGGIHVTPGPFSIYKREIFAKIGLFRKAHNTEDMEIAYRMQKNHMKIEHCNDAFVYTVTPNTVKKLYAQRLRWIYGFIKNTIDYRKMLFKKKYGVFSWFTVPSGIISIASTIVMFALMFYNLGNFFFRKALQVEAYGLSETFSSQIKMNWFYFNTQSFVILTIFLYVLLFTAIFIGSKMANGKVKFPTYVIPFVLIYSVIAPFWVLRAVWNTAFGKKTAWR